MKNTCTSVQWHTYVTECTTVKYQPLMRYYNWPYKGYPQHINEPSEICYRLDHSQITTRTYGELLTGLFQTGQGYLHESDNTSIIVPARRSFYDTIQIGGSPVDSDIRTMELSARLGSNAMR